MAMVDFTNAILEVVNSATQNPIQVANINLDSGLYDANNQMIGTFTRTVLINTPTYTEWVYTGTFTASGTEFYLYRTNESAGRNSKWKMSNISFQNGDNFVFQIPITLTCN